MPYYVEKIGKNVRGLTTLYDDGLLYFATNLAGPTAFTSKEEAQKYIEISKKKWPDVEFQIVYK